MKKKILVIDDEYDIRLQLVKFLELNGFASLTAESGAQGIEMARKELPDVIVCDILMPEISGYEVCNTLRNHPDTAMIPFIFLTAIDSREDTRKGMNLGADDYITKPFDFKDLLQSIHIRLEKRAQLEQHYRDKLKALQDIFGYAMPPQLRSSLSTIIAFSEKITNFNLLTATAEPLDFQRVGKVINRTAWDLLKLIDNYQYYAFLEWLRLIPKK